MVYVFVGKTLNLNLLLGRTLCRIAFDVLLLQWYLMYERLMAVRITMALNQIAWHTGQSLSSMREGFHLQQPTVTTHKSKLNI